LADPAVQAAIENGGSVTKDVEIVNVDRSALARVAGAVALKGGDRGFKGTIELNIRGSAGQSFGCFLAGGMKIKLTGEANDYVGKGMAGGEITIVPPEESTFAHEKSSIVGNTCLYGATGGKLFVSGRAGERFAVRNSMAEAVIEGTGDHCCEYMTGGVIVALGTVGRNVAAGMTGGIGYFYDNIGDFPDRVNGEIVTTQRIQTEAGKSQLKALIEEHVAKTGSETGKAILSNWDVEAQKFWQLVPPSEANTPEASKDAEAVMATGTVSKATAPAAA
jgi:glutamate synthase (ferredoxin)